MPPTLTLRCLHTPLKYNSPSVVPLDHTNIYFMDQSFICLLRKHRSGSFSLSLMQLYAFLVSPGTAAGIYRDYSLRILCFQDQGIGYNTDICTYTDQFQFIFFIKSVPVQPAKRGFIYVFTISCFQSGNDLPSIGTLNTMLYRQLLSSGVSR